MTPRPRVRIATCHELPEPDPDERLLLDALERAGVAATLEAWDDPRVAWDEPVPTVLRSTWNYHGDLPAFDAWLERAARAAPLHNPIDVVRWNAHKSYLAALDERGVAVVPTEYVARGARADLAAIAGARGWSSVVVKPAVSAGSFGTRRFDAGERSIVWVDGEITHVVCKAQRFADGHEAVTGPLELADDERALAHAALAPFADRLMYGRVDVARDAEGRARVLELELIEPSLHFRFAPRALDRLVAAIARVARG